jgi:hypothetical protein
VTRRVVIVPLTVPTWQPPGIDPQEWRRALADDLADLLASLAQADAAVATTAADRALADAVVWPTMRVYELPDLSAARVLATAAADGYHQAALIALDAPDLPAMLIGKLLRPLSSRPVAVAPAVTSGLVGLAAQLPAPPWLTADLDTEAAAVRAAAPRPGQVAFAPGWHRLTGPAELSRLDPALEGWEATRALLSAG